MNGLYDMMLFLFILGAASQGFNELGFFDHSVPDAGVTLGESAVTEVHSGALAQPANEFNLIEVVKSFMAVIGAGILAMFTIAPLLIGYMTMVGVDFGTAVIMAGMISVPCTFVTLFGLYEWWTGRPTT